VRLCLLHQRSIVLFQHGAVNHTIGFVDPVTGAHTTIDSQWKHLKASLNPYNRLSDYIYETAHYMFAARCRTETVDAFTLFLRLVASTDWATLAPPFTTAYL
jgi:hypothetical protein